MKAISTIWKEAEEASVGLPEGTYLFRCIESAVQKSKKGKIYLKNVYEIIGGTTELIGATHEKVFTFDKAKSIEFLIGAAQALGIECHSLEDAADGTLSKAFLGKQFEGEIVAGTTRKNLYERRPLTEDEHVDAPESKGALMFEVGARVSANFDNTMYEGNIEKMLDENKAKVKFDDGDIQKLALSDLTLIDSSSKGAVDSEPEEPEAEPDAPEESEPEPEQEEDDGLDELDRKALKKILKEKEIEFTVYKQTEDGAIREAIREASKDSEPDDPNAEPDEPSEPDGDAWTMPTLTEIKGMTAFQLSEFVFGPCGVDDDDVENPKTAAKALYYLYKKPKTLKAADVKILCTLLGVKSSADEAKTVKSLGAKLQEKISD